MANFVKISCEIKKFFVQKLEIQIDISKPEVLVRIYTDGQSDGHG